MEDQGMGMGMGKSCRLPVNGGSPNHLSVATGQSNCHEGSQRVNAMKTNACGVATSFSVSRWLAQRGAGTHTLVNDKNHRSRDASDRLQNRFHDVATMHFFKCRVPLIDGPNAPDDRLDVKLATGQKGQNALPNGPVVTETAL